MENLFQINMLIFIKKFSKMLRIIIVLSIVIVCNLAKSQTTINNSYVVNVKDFGALGNGKHDDSKAIQKAIDYCEQKSKKHLFFPDGNYFLLNPVRFKKGGVHLNGTGALLREESWFDVNIGIYKENMPFEGCSIIVPKNSIGLVFEETVADPVLISNLQFKSKEGRTLGNTVGILFSSEFKGPTWPFIIERCNFRGFNYAVKFKSKNQYNVAFVQFIQNAFSQNDECVYFDDIPDDRITNLGKRNLCWGFQFLNNKCHDNSRVIRGAFAKDGVDIKNNNLEGNILYSNGKKPKYIIDIELSNATVDIESNHFESIVSDAIYISSYFEKSSNEYFNMSGTTSGASSNKLFVKGNNFDGVNQSFKHFVLNGMTVYNYDNVNLYMSGCIIRLNESNFPNLFLSDEAKRNGSAFIFKFSDYPIMDIMNKRESTFIRKGMFNNFNNLEYLSLGTEKFYKVPDNYGVFPVYKDNWINFNNDDRFVGVAFSVFNNFKSGFWGVTTEFRISYDLNGKNFINTYYVLGSYGLSLGMHNLIAWLPVSIPKSAKNMKFSAMCEMNKNIMADNQIWLNNDFYLFTSKNPHPNILPTLN